MHIDKTKALYSEQTNCDPRADLRDMKCGFLSPVEVAELKGQASFWFQSDALAKVVLEFRVDIPDESATKERIKTLLTKKYGSYRLKENEIYWETSQTLINLSSISPVILTESEGRSFAIVWVSYESKAAAAEYERKQLEKL